MPGIVVFKRRWSVGSDDLVVPALFLVTLHIVWIIVLGVILGVVNFDHGDMCTTNLRDHVLGYLVILSGCVLVEALIGLVSMRGSILRTEPRSSMQYLLYVRLGVLVIEFVWLVIGVVWAAQHYQSCAALVAKRAVLGIIVCNWLVMLTVLISLWCTFDTAGRSWVKMKRYQESVREREHREGRRRRSGGVGSRRRNWRHRKAMRAYEESWDRRCRFLFCCVKEDRHRNSFTEVAKLFTEFFRDLDVVPSDIVAGLVLLRNHQKMRRKYIVSQCNNEVYQFLSGVPIKPSSQFVSLKNPDELAEYKGVVRYMRYALAAYGWPMYMMMNTGTGLCKVMPELNCCCCLKCRCSKQQHQPAIVLDDNCCQCNLAALKKLIKIKEAEIVYVTYHCDIGETPFFIALDHEQKTVVITIRGTLSLQDVLTDLKAEAEQLPVDPIREDWLGHKGMVQAAVYIKKKIKEEMLLAQAFSRDLDRGTQEYELILVGHSLGAGTAAILAILMRQEYPNLKCYAYSPPGGLISSTCVEETKSFITSVVVGKDVVPRIGLHQLESLRQAIINMIKKSSQPKWKIISTSMLCCCNPDNAQLSDSMMDVYEALKQDGQLMPENTRYFHHPSDSQIALTSHIPLFLPGRIIHVVRNHPKGSDKLCGGTEPVYQAVWADNGDFSEVLISPTMINDHMPDNVMEAVEKVLTNVSPAKPSRKLPESERKFLLTQPDPYPDDMEEEICSPNNVLEQPPSHRLCLETSFTNLEPLEMETRQHRLQQHMGELNELNHSYSLNSEANSLSWDYVHTLDSVPKRGCAPALQNRSFKAQSYPPPKPHFNLELPNGDDGWPDMAPLASPETLSDISSINSCSTRSSQKLPSITSSFPKMTPIQQSPTRQIRENGYYFVQPPSPVEGMDKDLSTVPDSDALAATQCNPPVIDNVESEQYVRGGPDATTSVDGNPCDLTDVIGTEDGGGGGGNAPQDGDNTEPSEEADEECSSTLGTEGSDEDHNFTRITDAEDVVSQPKNTDMPHPDPYELTFEDEEVDDLQNNLFDVSDGTIRLHSPDSMNNQFIYDEQLGHYSPAGRGYPHGGYMGLAGVGQKEGELEEEGKEEGEEGQWDDGGPLISFEQAEQNLNGSSTDDSDDSTREEEQLSGVQGVNTGSSSYPPANSLSDNDDDDNDDTKNILPLHEAHHGNYEIYRQHWDVDGVDDSPCFVPSAMEKSDMLPQLASMPTVSNSVLHGDEGSVFAEPSSLVPSPDEPEYVEPLADSGRTPLIATEPHEGQNGRLRKNPQIREVLTTSSQGHNNSSLL